VGQKKGLDIFPYGNVLCFPCRVPQLTSDAFNAVAEPRRRDILNYLALQSVRWAISLRAWAGAAFVSKHLRVLKDVGWCARAGKTADVLSNDAEAIRPLYEWASTFERLWQHQLQRVKERAEEKMKKA